MKKKILICDDEAAIRFLFSEALKDNCYITEASNGREALRMATNESFDLLIIDIKMPQIPGLKVIELIRERKITTPIIICSAFPLMKNDFVAKTLNVAAFITKPVDLEALKMKVFELIGE